MSRGRPPLPHTYADIRRTADLLLGEDEHVNDQVLAAALEISPSTVRRRVERVEPWLEFMARYRRPVPFLVFVKSGPTNEPDDGRMVEITALISRPGAARLRARAQHARTSPANLAGRLLDGALASDHETAERAA